MNDNHPSSLIDWTGQSSFKRRQRVRLLVAVVVMLMAFVAVMVLVYIQMASNTPLRGIF